MSIEHKKRKTLCIFNTRFSPSAFYFHTMKSINSFLSLSCSRSLCVSGERERIYHRGIRIYSHQSETIQSLSSAPDRAGSSLQPKPNMYKHGSFVKSAVIVFGPESKVCSVPTLLFWVVIWMSQKVTFCLWSAGI